jgi:hypothetical protein
VGVEALRSEIFMAHPLGVMIEGKPWIRSPRAVTEAGVAFYCQILEGMELAVMEPTDLVGETASALGEGAHALGDHVAGGVMFNCILRRLEIDATGSSQAFVQALGGTPTVGFHTYGESWLGHVNQTLTGVLFGTAESPAPPLG